MKYYQDEQEIKFTSELYQLMGQHIAEASFEYVEMISKFESLLDVE